jgi:hypothetical protein
MADVTDAELTSDIGIYRDYISERRFGKLFPKALSYFVAHMRTLNDMIAAAVADGGTAGDPSFTAGSLTREKEGDLERSYGAPSAFGSGDTESEALLKRTIYGQLFLQLRAMCIIPVMVRKGVGGCGCY